MKWERSKNYQPVLFCEKKGVKKEASLWTYRVLYVVCMTLKAKI